VYDQEGILDSELSEHENELSILNSMWDDKIVNVVDRLSNSESIQVRDSFVKNKKIIDGIDGEVLDYDFERSKTGFAEYQSGIRLYSTPIIFNSKEKQSGDEKLNKQLISYDLDGGGELVHLIFKSKSNLSYDMVGGYNDLPDEFNISIYYLSLNGETLLNYTISKKEFFKSYVYNSKSDDEEEERCASESWDDCVIDNLTKSGGAELLACMALGKYCAGGLAVGCAVDVIFEVKRPIYCEES